MQPKNHIVACLFLPFLYPYITMPIAGGAAGKKGDQFEAYWGVQAMIRILTGQVKSIQIEPPKIDRIEFSLVTHSALRENWQVKRQTSKGVWPLAILNQENVLRFLREQYDAGCQAVFASMSDAPQLHELLEYAHDGRNSLKDFLELIKYTHKERSRVMTKQKNQRP